MGCGQSAAAAKVADAAPVAEPVPTGPLAVPSTNFATVLDSGCRLCGVLKAEGEERLIDEASGEVTCKGADKPTRLNFDFPGECWTLSVMVTQKGGAESKESGEVDLHLSAKLRWAADDGGEDGGGGMGGARLYTYDSDSVKVEHKGVVKGTLVVLRELEMALICGTHGAGSSHDDSREITLRGNVGWRLV